MRYMIALLVCACAGAGADELADARARRDQAEGTLTTALAQLTDGQRVTLGDVTWFPRYRAYMATVAVYEEDGKSGGGVGEEDVAAEHDRVVYHDTVAGIAMAQLDIVRAVTHPVQADDEWTGVWRDGNRGQLRIVQEDGRLLFEVDVVCGPTHHLGTISGSAKANEQVAWYSDEWVKTDKPADAGPTWITMVRIGPVLQLTGSNTGHYHGARANFDGRYFRVAKLTDQDAGEVRQAVRGERDARK